MYRDICLFHDQQFIGWYPLESIEEELEEYRRNAEKLAEEIDWDECIVYGIFRYNGETQAIVSADFMLLRMPYRRYLRLFSELSRDCRIFFIRNR